MQCLWCSWCVALTWRASPAKSPPSNARTPAPWAALMTTVSYHFTPPLPRSVLFLLCFFYMNIVCVERLAARCERKCRIKCYPAGDLLKSFSKFYNLYRKKKLFLKINLNFSIFFYSNYYYYYYEVTFWCDTCL